MIERDDQHIYRKDGKIYISCTQHLQIAGLVDFSMVRPADLEFARLRGNHVHDAVRLFLNDDLNLDKPMEGYRGYVEAFIKFSKDHNLKVWDSECFLWSDRLRTAGQLDFIGSMGSDHSAPAFLFEIKTPTVMPLTAPLQIAGYLRLWAECKKNALLGGYGLQLKANGKYRLFKYYIPKYAHWFGLIARCNWNALSNGIIPIGARSDENVYNLCKSIIGG